MAFDFTRDHNVPTNPLHIKPAKEAESIAQLSKDFNSLITALKAGTAYATATLDCTADVILSSVEKNGQLNGLVVILIVAAAADNTPASTVLISTALVDNDLTITVTPDSLPVALTTAQLVLAINGSVSGTYDSIPVDITDTGGYLALMKASGGGATALAASGEGDDATGAFWGGY